MASTGPATENLCERHFYAIPDANYYNVLGMVNHAGCLVERCSYNPYGRRTVFSHGWSVYDVNADGVVDSLDVWEYGIRHRFHSVSIPIYLYGSLQTPGGIPTVAKCDTERAETALRIYPNNHSLADGSPGHGCSGKEADGWHARPATAAATLSGNSSSS